MASLLKGDRLPGSMYYQYFGLNEAPFSIAVNPRYLFMSDRHRDALAHLLYGVGAGGGFILLTGEVGTGKTTINRCLLEQLPDNTDLAIILNPALNAIELLATVCDELGIKYEAQSHSLKTLTDSLHQYLLANYQRGRKTVLMIDEAQHLDFDVLEQIRLLTNLETHSEKLLQIILIGQPELAHMLAQPELRQLNQRITARYNLGPLNLAETRAYIRHRLQVAGMSPGRDVFPEAVIKGIHRRTRGIPRLINVLCDRILLGAYGRNKTRADNAMLELATREVMGEQPRRSWNWLWPALVSALVVAALLSWWALDRRYNATPELVPQASSQIQQQAAPSQIPVVTPQPALPEGQGLSVPLAPPVEQAAASAGAGLSAAIAARGAAPPVDDWLLPPSLAMTMLWGLYSNEPEPSFPCEDDEMGSLACVDAAARTWDELAVLDRPLLLDMITPERFSASVVLLGISGRSAWVWNGAEVQQVDLQQLAPLWSGRYRFLWQPPEGFDRPVALGDNSPVVTRIAELFARLDDQPQALSGSRFNQPLQQRVRLFQREYQLEDDGVVGMQTLLRLNTAVGVDPSAETARATLQKVEAAGRGSGPGPDVTQLSTEGLAQ
jgi:general secretion pathway protein A